MRNKRVHDALNTNPEDLKLQGLAYDEFVAALSISVESGPVLSSTKTTWLTFEKVPISASAIMGLRASTEIVVHASGDRFVIEQYWGDPLKVRTLHVLQETSKTRRAKATTCAITEGQFQPTIPPEKHDAIKAITHAILLALDVSRGNLGNSASCSSSYTSDGDVELRARIDPPLLMTELRGLSGVMDQYGVRNMRLTPREGLVELSMRL